MDIKIEEMREADWKAVREIYGEGIATTQATFEQDLPDWSQWDQAHLKVCRFVVKDKSRTIGWAALSPVSERPVYSGVAEVSLYVSEKARGRGIGVRLLNALINASEQSGFWTLQGGIFPENKASLAVHKACGFRTVGYRKRIGRMAGQWRDVVLMERRSTTVGIS